MKGQFFSSDFIASAVIFIFLLLLLLPLWNEIIFQIADAEAKKNLQIAASSISELLVKVPGSPANWTPDDVGSIGLVNKVRVLNLTKFEYLRQVDYEDAKELLGINQYNFSINVTNEYGLLATSGIARSPVAYFSADKEELKSVIANSGLTWDFYWGHDLPGTEPDHEDSRFFYEASKADALNALLVNASSRGAYRTVIVEEPDLALSDVNQTALSSFLADGGRFMLEGRGFAGNLIIEGYGANSSTDAPADGIALAPDWFVRSGLNDTVTFQSAQWAVHSESDGALTIEVADLLNLSRGLIASWNHGPGRLYYISDANGMVGGSQLTSALNIAGQRLEYGVYPTDTENVVIANRLVVYEGSAEDGRQLGRMRLVIWE